MLVSKLLPDWISLQDRDLALLRELFESRVMTAALVALHFDGKKEAAKKSLQKLKAAQFIAERKRRVSEPSTLFLTRQGIAVLQNEGVLDDYPQISLVALQKRAQVSDLTLRHQLEIMDVTAAFHSAMRETGRFTVADSPPGQRFTSLKHVAPGTAAGKWS